MVERAPEVKSDEQYPLLKVEGGEGDGSGRNANTATSPGWNVTWASKRSLLDRWPEFMAACWMTGILLGISFLVMYILAMGAIRRHSVLILKCNNSKPASDVFYHHIVQRGSNIPFQLYSKYLANMALDYPLLHFNVFFLMDDSSLTNAHRGSRHAKLFGRLIPYHPRDYIIHIDESNLEELENFERRYKNVNITVMPLSKFMARTHLRYKWRTIPLSYLPFYARIFSVWQSGGVGIDLDFYNRKFNSRQGDDRRITAILQQHNDGIKPEQYTIALNNIEKDEETEFFSMFYGLVNQVLNETRSFFNKSFSFTQFVNDKEFALNEPLVRTHRNKRDITMQAIKSDIENDTNNIEPIKLAVVNTTAETTTPNGITQTSAGTVALMNNTKILDTKYMDFKPINEIQNNIKEETTTLSNSSNIDDANSEIKIKKIVRNMSELPEIVLFYDISLLSNGIGPPFIIPEALQPNVDPLVGSSDYENTMKRNKALSYILSMDSEGLFVSASSRLHPFLGHLLSADGCQRMQPKFAIQGSLLTQCPGLFKDDMYCKNIHLM